MMWVVIGMVALALVVIFSTQLMYKLWIRNNNCNGISLLPGSMGWPLIGETFDLIVPSYSLDLPPFIQTRLQRYGPVFRTSLAGQPVAISADREFNNYLFLNEGKLVDLWYLDSFSQIFSMANMNTIGEFHKYLRCLLSNHFGSEILRKNLLTKIQHLANETLHSWSSSTADTEITQAIPTMMFNFAADHLFGYKHNNEHSSANVNPEIFTQALDGLMYFPLNIPGTKFHKCIKNQKTAFNFLKDLLYKRKASSSPETPHRGDFLDQIIEELEKESSLLKEDEAIGVMFGIVIATIEPIAKALTLAFKFLSQASSATQQLIVEHEKILKLSESSDSSSLSWDEYKSMTFTYQVINEILRLNNHMPGVLRRASKDIQFGDYTIPAGWTIMLVTPALHLNPDTFNDPLMFNPWRWKGLDPEFVWKNFMPFGLGRRQCAGADFTRVFLAAFLHVLVTKYRWTMVKEGVFSRSPVLSIGRGFYVNFSRKA